MPRNSTVYSDIAAGDRHIRARLEPSEHPSSSFGLESYDVSSAKASNMKEEGYQIQQIPRSSPKSLVRSSTDNLWLQTYSYPLANTLTPLSSTQI